MDFKTVKFLVILASLLFPVLVFLAWFGFGILFHDRNLGFWAGIVFGFFYGLRILYYWIKPLED